MQPLFIQKFMSFSNTLVYVETDEVKQLINQTAHKQTN